MWSSFDQASEYDKINHALIIIEAG
jgi:hypothetical protein